MTTMFVYEIAGGGVLLDSGRIQPPVHYGPEEIAASALVEYAESRSMSLVELDGLTGRCWPAGQVDEMVEVQGSEWRP